MFECQHKLLHILTSETKPVLRLSVHFLSHTISTFFVSIISVVLKTLSWATSFKY